MRPIFKTIALFGANGQVGKTVFEALMRCKDPAFHIIAFVSPKSSSQLESLEDARVTIKRVDLNMVTCDELATILADGRADVVISALGGQIIAKQGLVQDAAAQAGVKRFYPSEFGMHQLLWLPGEPAYIHPIWDVKIRCFKEAIQHPAIKSGSMSYTVIGCADSYDAAKEPLFCPWLETETSFTQDGYTIHCVGNPEAKMDYSTLHDTANFLVASLIHPELSENKCLGFRSDHISFREVADLLRKYSGKPVRLQVTPVDQVKEILKNPSSAPVEWHRRSTFPIDFFLTLRCVQGQGVFWRPPGLLHNNLFPEVQPVTVAQYFERLFKK
ncbi:NAD(P)-binding protein [Aspergillus fijiensis CBS 313.89]|uniref:NAD(P)-binding protein n=1 Tax=Aspergillus fijiensis CBS 313.89 TaxID=1448319 RepID=A0A8G1VVY7_9EURO|nr:NAD(P)-binding protein [Aspergillus fijiensis CBS 313.89]RAK71434.1 NAD(P)-binding protein [Aspergillus fijiensis CBS 313.89]